MTVCPPILTLNDLPAPPADKVGWPWTVQSEPLPSRQPDGAPWPRISIVTPSYNYGHFLEETIRSVLLQGYPNLEYIIIDGCSTDNSVEIIRKYERFLTFWISEPDQGQTDAINKGYQRCTGEIFSWLNADDAYRVADCLISVAELYCRGNSIIVGQCSHVDANNQPIQIDGDIGISPPQTFWQYAKFWSYTPLPQPAVFISTSLTNQAFPMDTSLHWTMDYQLFLRILSYKPKAIWVDHAWVNFKYHGANKTLNSNINAYRELHQVATQEVENVANSLSKKLFRLAADDCLMLALLQVDTIDFWRFLKMIAFRPSLMRWSLFWKLSIRGCLGDKQYEFLKQAVTR